MKPIPFPFSGRCYITVWQNRLPLESIAAEEATTRTEIEQALNYRNYSSFRQPMVLHFPDPALQQPVWFGFHFPVELIVTDLEGYVKKITYMPAARPGTAKFIQFFSNCAYAILAPEGFSKKWALKEQETQMRLLSFQKQLATAAL